MTISIVVPSFNQAAYIGETLLSFKNDLSSIQAIVIDGGSEDGSVEVISESKKDLYHWLSEPDRGQSHAINKGLMLATGEVLNWINSDDYLEPGAIAAIEKAFSDPMLNVFVGRSNIVRDGMALRQSRGTDVHWGNLPKTIGQARIDQPEHWWRKSVIDEIGPLNEELHYTMDRDWWVKYLLRYGLEGIKKEKIILANFRLHGESKTISQGDSFKQERNSYYRSLSTFYGLVEHADHLDKLVGAGTIPMTNLPKSVNLEVLNASFTYFYLLLADEFYIKGDHAKVRQFLKILDESSLADEDREFADKLRFRSKFPSGLIKTVKKWRG